MKSNDDGARSEVHWREEDEKPPKQLEDHGWNAEEEAAKRAASDPGPQGELVQKPESAHRMKKLKIGRWDFNVVRRVDLDQVAGTFAL